ncbi:MAG TPA: glycosyltransferase family 2 protein [Acidimicrobiales bacterium]
MTERMAISYVLPLRTEDNETVAELAAYLKDLASVVEEVLVVDGSSPLALADHQSRFSPTVTVVPPQQWTLMGKVGNVMTGVRLAAHDRVIIADDDVRFTADQLAHVAAALDEAEIVRPQNYFDPLPWHARFDTARTLLNRVTGGDWPGTLAVRRSFLLRVGGYSGDVLFENLELVRTVRAAGGRERLLLDLIVRRVPPTASHFRGQQVRQAYDELARPARLAVFLAVLPAVTWACLTRKEGALAGGAVLVMAAAEAGRRRAGGSTVFPGSSSVVAPIWLLWRSGCAWCALGARARGGVRYRDTRFQRAATPARELRRRYSSAKRKMGNTPPVELVDEGGEHVGTASVRVQ